MWLMRGSLAEMEVLQARVAQIETYKKEISRKSLSKGGSLLASDVF